MKIRLLVAVALFSVSFAVFAAKPSANPYVSHVKRIYANFGAEEPGTQSGERQDTLTQQSESTQLKFLSPKLVNLIAKDKECAEKSEGPCQLDFSILWNSQDPTASDVRILPVRGTKSVIVRYRSAELSTPVTIRYELIMTKSGPLVSDIIYDGTDSLVSILQSTNAD